MLLEVDDAIKAQLFAGRIGAQTLTTNEMTIRLPTVTSKLIAEVVAQDGSLTEADEPTFDEVSVSPVTMGCLASILRSAMYTGYADRVIADQIRNAIVEKSDSVILGPTGGAPTPEGILDTDNSTAATETTITLDDTAYESAIAIKDELGAYLQTEQLGTWALYPAHIDSLGGVIKGTGLTVPVIQNSMLADRPVVGSYALPLSTSDRVGLYGDFSMCYFVIFGESIDLSANPYGATDWARGSTQLRSLMDFNFISGDPSRILSFVTAAAA